MDDRCARDRRKLATDGLDSSNAPSVRVVEGRAVAATARRSPPHLEPAESRSYTEDIEVIEHLWPVPRSLCR